MLIFMNNVSGTPLEFHKITTQKEAEDFVYASYLRAATHQDYAAQDAGKRHPELTRSLLRQKSMAPCVVVTGRKGLRFQYDLPDPADKLYRRTDD